MFLSGSTWVWNTPNTRGTEHTTTETDKYIFILHRLTVVLSLEKGGLITTKSMSCIVC